MLNLSPEAFVAALQSFPPEMIGVFSFSICALAVVWLMLRFGALGLCVYSVVAILAANVQVLKTGHFSLLAEPVALGTVVSGSCFLAIDLATEHYGPALARQMVWLGFFASILWILCTLLVLGVGPHAENMAVHEAMTVLFMPTPAIVLASLCAYIASQQLEITLFQRIKKQTGVGALWLRSSVSMCFSAFCDTVIFSTLAWVVFAPIPVDTHTLVWTYIIGTFLFRLAVMLGNVGVMYCVRFLKK